MSKHFRVLAAAGALVCGLHQSPASAQEIGVTISNFNDNFLTLLRQAMSETAEQHQGTSLQFEDSQLEVGRQLDQVQNFVASGVDGIIIAPVDGGSTEAMTAAAEQSGIPVVYTNNLPVNLDQLPPNQVFVGSDETESGRMQGEEICRQLKDAGIESATAVILLGDLSNPATPLRTESAKAAFASEGCPSIDVVDEQTATWQRNQASDLMTNWLTAGIQPDVVVANNDEMAIGAILAMKAVGVDMKKVIVAGIDATPDALAAMAAGDMDVTVLQSARGQGKAIVETMLALIAGQDVPREVYVPYELVTPANYQEFLPN
ncbi:MAG: substrate-binding domain-containing protein [Rhodobacteraceae bacterium]|nr:substrate-binding domain-containing protein [Paracoccaceae bacterium]